MRHRFIAAAIAVTIVAIVAMTTAHAQIASTLHASLTRDGAGPKPATPPSPETANASGTATFTLDQTTRQLKWQLSVSGLSSEITAAHIHAPSGGVVVVDLARGATGPVIEGSATIDDSQIADLMGGRDTIDVHTRLNQNGEIHGQVLP